jgi:selenide,water dikinase
VGTKTADDAAVYRLSRNQALVATVDYFTPVVDDPYAFGLITGANSLSDVYAMGGTPIFALNIMGFPKDKLPMSILSEILKGGAAKAAEANVPIIGGHTIDDPEPKYGMAVTGLVHPDKVVTNASAKVGDDLYLTKPLGMGIITTGIKASLVSDAAIAKAIGVMATLNKAAGEAMVEVGVNAATDITGFGLLGHLHEMTAGSGVKAEIQLSKVPVLDEAWQLIEDDIAPAGSHLNREFLASVLEWDEGISFDQQLVLCDAQTSGGLLISVPHRRAKKLELALQSRGVTCIARIGRIVDTDERGTVRIAR